MLSRITTSKNRLGALFELVTKTSHSQVHRTSSRGHGTAVRVRFAPSPTGEMHLGGLRTALYNFLFARHEQGQFIVRVEDTDQSRIVQGSQDRMLDILTWAGLHPDEGPGSIGGPKGPYVQSQRLEFYKEFAEKLIHSGAAYRCFCTQRRLDLIRKDALRRRETPKYDNKCRHLTEKEIADLMSKNTPHVVRFKLKEGPLTFQDVVFGSLTLDLSAVEGDFVVLKSDGFPTYHLANVVDDHLMQISHVLRGVEWQLSTPKHIQMFEALGLTPPMYAHLPLLMNEDGSKLSKRNQGFYCEHLRGKFLPEAVLNFLLLSGGGGLGKTTGDFYHVEDFIENFRLEKLSTTSCKVALSRLDDFNRQAIACSGKSLENEAFALVKKQHPHVDEEYFMKAFHANKERLTFLSDLLSPEFAFMWQDLPAEKVIPEHLKQSFVRLLDLLKDVSFEIEEISKFLKTFHEENVKECSYPEFMKILRKLISNLPKGPGVAEMMSVLGKSRSLSRISRGL